MGVVNLKLVRERLGKTIDQVSDRVGVSHSTIVQWEADPDSLPYNKLTSYAKALGLTASNLIKEATSKYAEWSKVKVNADLQAERLKIKAKIDEIQEYIEKNGNVSINDETKNYFVEIQTRLKTLLITIRKPRIVLAGESDSGKSTMLNSMLGTNRISTHWQPATSQIIRVVHSDDKPAWVNGNTVVIKNNPSDLIESWELLDKQVYDQYIVEEGDEQLLSKYGDREGDLIPNNDGTQYTIFTYLDAPILNSVELWDTPGISAGLDAEASNEENLSNYAQSKADTLIYLSIANQFLHSADISYLNNIFSTLENQNKDKGLAQWSNLYIVGSQAGNITNSEDIPNILNTGYERLIRVLPVDVNKKNALNGFKDRFFSFANDNYDLSYRLINQFAKDNAEYQQLMYTKATTQWMSLQAEVDTEYNNVSDQIDKKKHDQADFVEQAKQAYTKLKDIKLANARAEEEAILEAENQRKLATNQFIKSYKRILNVDNLINDINDNNFKNKKSDKIDFQTHVKGQLDAAMKEVLQKSGEAYADKYKTIAEKIQISSKIDNTYFNFKNIGISLISGGVSYGALAFLATQIPSNLGLYLGIGSIGGTLTSMGLIASPIVLTTAVAATGGPIVWGIGLAIFASSLVMAIFGKSTWKKKLAQKINKDFEKIDALNKYEQAINGFWKDTIIGVRKNREAMDKVAEDQANKITHMVDFEGDDYLDKLRNGLNDLKKLLMN